MSLISSASYAITSQCWKWSNKTYKSSNTLSTMKFLICSHQVLNASLTFHQSSQCVPKDGACSNTPCPITFAQSWTFITLCRAKRREPNYNFILGCNLLFSILRGCVQSFKFRNYVLRAPPPANSKELLHFMIIYSPHL